MSYGGMSEPLSVKCGRRMQGIVIDGMIGVSLLAMAGGVGYHYLRAHVGTIGNQTGDYSTNWFTPSIMFACGRGLVSVPHAQVPCINEFLEYKTQALDPQCLPGELPSYPPIDSQGVVYLLYAVGALWRLWGISWEALKILPAIAFGLSVAIVYGLFRLGANRFLSIVGALLFLSAPGVLKMLPCVRDFCKVPFILGAIFLMGCIVRGPMSTRVYWAVSALLGVVLGIGSGFRQDIVLFVLPGLLVVALGASRAVPMGVRAIAIVLLALGFLVPGWPILAGMREGYIEQSPHLMQGFSTECIQDLGIGVSSFSSTYSKHDNYIYATQHSYDQRVNGAKPNQERDPNAATAGRQWVTQVIKTFPADMVTRLCAAVLWSLGRSVSDEPYPSGWHRNLVAPLAEHMASYGPFYAGLTLLLLSAQSMRLAWNVFLLAVFVCGYVGILFESRHSFHLYFVPFWILAFLTDKAIRGAGRLLKRSSRQRPREWPGSCHGGWKPSFRRMGLFACSASMVVLVLFWSLRTYQHFRVEAALKHYRSAVLEPVATRATPDGDWVLIEPESHLASLDGPRGGAGMDVATEYCVAEFASSAGTFPMQLRYQPNPIPADISTIVNVQAAGSQPNQVTKYFFPVYEYTMGEPTPDMSAPEPAVGRGRFIGVAIPKAHAAEFKGFYRVTNTTEFPILFLLSLPDEGNRVRYGQRLLGGATYQSRLGIRYQQQERFDEAIAAFRRAHAYEPLDEEITGNLASAIGLRAHQRIKEGQPERALADLRDAAALAPNNTNIRQALNSVLLTMSQDFEQRGEWENAMKGYREIESHDKGNLAIRFAIAAVYKKRGDSEAAIAAYRDIITTNPEHPVAYGELEGLYVKQGNDAARMTAMQSIVREHPQIPRAHFYLARVFAQRQDYVRAVEACQKAHELAPEDPVMAGQLVCCLANWGQQLLERRQFYEAREAYQRALTIEPDSVGTICGLAETSEKLGNLPDAMTEYRKAIATDPGSRESYERLRGFLLRQRKPEDRIAVWREIAEAFPQAPLAHCYLASELDAAKDYDAAATAYRTAHTLDPNDATVEGLLGIALMRIPRH